MLQTIVAGLIITLITSLAIMAYRHPYAYAKIYYPLLYLVLAAYGFAALWNFPYYYAGVKLVFMSDVPAKETELIMNFLETCFIPRLPTVLIFTPLIIYLAILKKLPNFLHKSEKNSPE